VTEKMREDSALVATTRRWQSSGVFVLLLLVLAFPAYLVVESGRRADALASQNTALVMGGRQLWAQNCTTCHGVSGQGGTAPALNSQEFLGGASDLQIHGIIAGGVPGTAMPAWWNEYGGPLTDQQISELVAYLRAWQPKAPSIPNWRTPNG
jgi:mono/diheme cytochrome c family protein